MNYFGHSVLAAQMGASPPFVLGSMLPDLVSMARAGRVEFTHAVVRAGIRFHHRTDEVFHASPAFRELEHDVQSKLSLAGVRKGPSRAAAHLGVEFLFDAALLAAVESYQSYEDALASGLDDAHLAGMPTPTRHDFQDLLRHLIARGADVHVVTPERLELRLGRTLVGRRLLEPTTDELVILARVVGGSLADAERLLPKLLEDLRPLLDTSTAPVVRSGP